MEGGSGFPDRAELKCVVLGGIGVGKTSMVIRYIDGSYAPSVSTTVGAFFMTKKTSIEDCTLTLQIWDTAGQERFKAMAPMYYRNAACALLVFDVTDERSFMCMKEWVDELQTNHPTGIVLGIACNKSDLEEHRVVSFERAEGYAKSVGACIRDTSAKSNDGVTELFEQVAALALRAHVVKLQQQQQQQQQRAAAGAGGSSPAGGGAGRGSRPVDLMGGLGRDDGGGAGGGKGGKGKGCGC